MKKLSLCLLLPGLLLPQVALGQTPEPVVHAVLFYSPTCPHCHQVITEYLIPLQEQFGQRVLILGMDTSQGYANSLYWEAMRELEIPQEQWVVPILVVGDEFLVGGNEIPDRFRNIVEEGLAAGGIDLPGFPAMVTFLREQDLLDPRFPDRLIARQDPPVPAGPTDPAADSTPTEEDRPEEVPSEPIPSDTATSPDSIVGPDTVAESEEEARPDSVVTAEPPEPESGRVVEPRTSGEEVRDPATEDPGQVPAAEDSAIQELEPEGAVSRPEPPVQGGEQETGGGQEAGGPVGLEEAARGIESMTWRDRFNLDPAGNSLSILILLGVVVSLALRGFPSMVKGSVWPAWVVPALVLVGMAVAGYLSFVEVTDSEAVCGFVGDCNTVNQSEYATLFGVLPVGVLGLLGYGGILILWAMEVAGPAAWRRLATVGLWGAALLGTLFSAYLTFLEPFVIGATCIWCLTSAVIMTLLLWASSASAARVWGRAGGPS